MQITRKDNSTTNITLSIELNGAELSSLKKHVLSSHFADTKVPGFRVGRAPAELLEKNINQQTFLNELMDHAVNEYFRRAVDQENIRPVGQPKIEIKKFVPDNLMEFSITIDVLGNVKLADYKKIKLAKPKISVTVKDVNDVISSVQKQLAQRVEVKRPAKNGDELVIDFLGKDTGGKPIAGADGKGYPLTLGSKTFIPGFEEKLVGVESGDDKTIKVTFPADYGVAALQSKPVTFNVTVKKISELKMPKVDDELATKAGPFKSLSELKADIKKQLTLEKQSEADRQYQDELVKTISQKSKLDVPEQLVEDQLNRQEEEEKRNLLYRGQTWQEHLKEEGVTQEQHRERQRAAAQERVKAGLVLSEISAQEKIDVTPQEVEQRINILKGQYQDPAMQAELDKPENRQEITARLLTEKTLTALVNYASK